MGEGTCCDYTVKAVIDHVNKTVSESDVLSPTDGSLGSGLKIFGKNITTKHLVGYGTIDEPCGGTKGLLLNPDNTSEYLCVDNNFTGNFVGLLYDPVSHKILGGTGSGGNRVHVVDPDTLNRIGYLTHSRISERGFVNLIPRDDEKVFIVYAYNKGTGLGPLLGIGIVDIQDIIDNASSNPNIDDLGSYQQLYETTDYNQGGVAGNWCNGSKIWIMGHDGTNPKSLLYDPVNNTLNDLGVVGWDKIIYPLTYQKWLQKDETNKKYIILDDDAQTVIQEISDTDIIYIGVAFHFLLLSDPSTDECILKGLSIDGSTVPIVQWDLENKKFRVIDMITGNPISMDVYIIWSRLQMSYSEKSQSIPYVANNRISTMTVNGWTDIPNPPTNNVRVLYVIPDFLGVGV